MWNKRKLSYRGNQGTLWTKRPRSTKRVKRTRFNSNRAITPSAGIPNRFNVRMVTALQENITGEYTSIVKTLNLNSLFDPLGTFGATQPNGYDQIKALYEAYHVDRGVVRLNLSHADASPVTMVAYISTNATAQTTFAAAATQPGAKFTVINTADSTNSNIIIPWNRARAQGRTKVVNDDASVGSNPINLVYLHILCSADTNMSNESILTVKMMQAGYLYARSQQVDA